MNTTVGTLSSRPARMASAAPWIAVLLAAASAGCISYRLDLLPPAPALPAPVISDNRPSIAYSIASVTDSDFASSRNGFPGVNTAQPLEETGAILLRSGWFSSVQQTAEGRQADLQLSLVLTANSNDVVMLVSVCTFSIIPMWRTVMYDLSAEVRTRDGTLRRYELQDGARDIFWLPIILGMSFRPWGEAYGEVRDNMYRTLLARMNADGLLRPGGPAPAAITTTAGSGVGSGTAAAAR